MFLLVAMGHRLSATMLFFVLAHALAFEAEELEVSKGSQLLKNTHSAALAQCSEEDEEKGRFETVQEAVVPPANLSKDVQQFFTENLAQLEHMTQMMTHLQDEQHNMAQMITHLQHEQHNHVPQDDVRAGQQMVSPLPSPLESPAHRSSVSELFEGCRTKGHTLHQPRRAGHTAAKAQEVFIQQQRPQGATNATQVCLDGFLKLMVARPDSLQMSCCPIRNRACAGCEMWSPNNVSCVACSVGFTKRNGFCTRCIDMVGWLDEESRTCQQLADMDSCSDDKVGSISSNLACCHCGGGQAIATPFMYAMVRQVVGADIDMYPEPRTAARYSLDQGCMLAKHGLTMNGVTGAVWGRSKSKEPVEIECMVTAHQSAGLTFTAELRISIVTFGYPATTLVFSAGSRYVPLKHGTGWTDFQFDCAPQIKWLHINSSTGALQLNNMYKDVAGGAVTNIDGHFPDQDGGVCIVSARSPNSTNGTEEGFQEQETTVVALKLNPWPYLRYLTDTIEVTVGAEAPLLQLQEKESRGVPEHGSLPPSNYLAACSIKEAGNDSLRFTFDELLRVGYVAGHPVLSLRSDGSLAVAPAASLAEIFESHVFSLARKSLTLGCTIYGLFQEPSLPAVTAKLDVRINDNVCWVQQHFNGSSITMKELKSLSKCRLECRKSLACSHIGFSDGICRQFWLNSGGPKVNAWAKVTDCTEMSTCLKVHVPNLWYVQGRYCPVGEDVLRGTVYQKAGNTPQETLYLVRHVASVDGVLSDKCAAANHDSYVFREKAPGVDVVDKDKGQFDLRGPVHACLGADIVGRAFSSTPVATQNTSGSVSISPASCSAPRVKDTGGKADSPTDIQVLVLDDPGTTGEADFWVHPCDCSPPAWGPAPPVDAAAAESIPPGSHNRFVPAPFAIALGQFVCPMSEVLHIYLEDESEDFDSAACESQCRANVACNFFWVGTQRGASTCRLYQGCGRFAREFAMSGSLLALPRKPMCQIASPDACWAVTLRREFLTNLRPVRCSSHICPRNMAHKADYSKIICGFRHEADGGCTDAKCCDVASSLVEAGFQKDEQELGAASQVKDQGLATSASSGAVVDRLTAGAGGQQMQGSLTEGVAAVHDEAAQTTRAATFLMSGDNITLAQQEKGSTALKWLYCGNQEGRLAIANTCKRISCHDSEQCRGTTFQFYMGPWRTAVRAGAQILIFADGDRNLLLNQDILVANAGVLKDATWFIPDGDDEKDLGKLFVEGDLVTLKKNTWTTYNLEGAWKIFGNLSGTCDSGMYLNMTERSCKKNKCTCQFGTGATYLNCPSNGDAICISCRHGYHLEGAICRPKRCTCEFGAAATLTDCPADGRIFCISCNLGYSLEKTLHSLCKPEKLQYAVPKFHYLHLHQQCDQALLLGGIGVQECARPHFADPASHHWDQKRPLPETFQHGEVLAVWCWPERFVGLSSSGNSISKLELHCSNSHWFDVNGHLGLVGIQCAPCAQLSAPGYIEHMVLRKQELVWHNKIRTSIYSDLIQKWCLERTDDSTVKLQKGQFCREYLFREAAATNEESRLVELANSSGECLSSLAATYVAEILSTESLVNSTPGLRIASCNGSDTSQLIPVGQIPNIFQAVLKIPQSEATDWHRTSEDMTTLTGRIECGTLGALGMISFSTHMPPTCKFAPWVTASEWRIASYGGTTSSGGSRWKHQLAAAAIDCGVGRGIVMLQGRSPGVSALGFSPGGLAFKCAIIMGLGVCSPVFSEQEDASEAGLAISVLNRMKIDCTGNQIIRSFQLEFSESGGWVRWRYSCCSAGGVPTVLDPVDTEATLNKDYEGIYCPADRDLSGRLLYTRRSSLGKNTDHRTLEFDPRQGLWCLGPSCVPSALVEPFGIQGDDFEVVPLDDFDGVFTGQQVGENGELGTVGDASELGRRFAREMPGTRSGWQAPKQPKEITFEPIDPEYAQECKLDQFHYPHKNGKFWEDISDTSGSYKLKWSETNVQPDHPCKVAESVGGKFDDTDISKSIYDLNSGQLTEQGQSGDGEAHTGLDYTALFDCRSREMSKEYAQARVNAKFGAIKNHAEQVLKVAGAACGVLPDVIAAPLGGGVAAKAGRICNSIKEVVNAVFMGTTNTLANMATKNIATKMMEDCDPLQANFARLFCDLHCVRDVVLRGDLNLRRNLKKATDITNRNMRLLSEWSVGSLQAQMEAINLQLSKRLADLSDLVKAPKPRGESSLEQSIGHRMAAMLQELQGFGEQAAFDPASGITAESALANFVGSTSQFEAATNATHVVSALEKFASLHAVLKLVGSRSKTSSASIMIQEGVRHLQQTVRTQLAYLGMYRQHSASAKDLVRSWSGARIASVQGLLALDNVWWRLRRTLDAYMTEADAQVAAFRAALEAMAGYRDCMVGFSELSASYNSATRAREEGHKHLQHTWLEAVDLLGELSSVIADGELFATFVAKDGCNSSLVDQSMEQARLAVGALQLLLHRFEVGGLPEPDLEPLSTTVERIQSSYRQAKESC